MDLVAKVERYIETERLLREKDSVVVAVSGGPDSVALLHILFALSEKWKWKLIVAHVNHGFRGRESEEEAEFVGKLAATLQLPCEIGTIDVPGYIEESGRNAQAAAREKRYEFLHQTAQKYGAGLIALAHHADDQAETLLMRVVQGTGPSGLTGIPMRRFEKKVELIRPLLRIYKTEILEYCRRERLDYRIDSSNLVGKYYRNRIRLELMPQLTRMNPLAPQAINRLAEAMRAEDAYMAAATDDAFERLITSGNGEFRFSRSLYAALHLALQRRLIKLILSYLASGLENIDFTCIELAREAIVRERPTNLKLDLGDMITLIREYDTVIFSIDKGDPHKDYDQQVTEGADTILIPSAGAEFTFRWSKARNVFTSQGPCGDHQEAHAVFDADLIAFPLHIRNRRPGDRIRMLGLNGSKKVKDIFIDDKIPPSRRNIQPHLVDANGRILWVPGLRRSDYAMVTEETKCLLHVSVTFFIK